MAGTARHVSGPRASPLTDDNSEPGLIVRHRSPVDVIDTDGTVRALGPPARRPGLSTWACRGPVPGRSRSPAGWRGCASTLRAPRPSSPPARRLAADRRRSSPRPSKLRVRSSSGQPCRTNRGQRMRCAGRRLALNDAQRRGVRASGVRAHVRLREGRIDRRRPPAQLATGRTHSAGLADGSGSSRPLILPSRTPTFQARSRRYRVIFAQLEVGARPPCRA